MSQNKRSPRGSRKPDSTSAELATYLLEDAEDRKAMRVSLWVAVAVHVLILLINFPSFTADLRAGEKKDKKVFKVQEFKYQPPIPDPPEAPRKRAKRIPIPDPTPDDPEPLRIEEPQPEIELDFDGEIPFDLPDAPPEIDEAPVGPIQVGGNVKRPVKLHTPPPRYTELARRARVQGTVFVQAIIDKQGDVTEVRLIKGLPMGLSEEAVRAVQGWKFKPATLNGKPVDVFYNLTVHFSLQ